MDNSTFNHRFYCLTDKQLVDYKKGDVAPAERVWAAQHLSKCEDCSKALEQLKVVKENQYGMSKTVVKGDLFQQSRPNADTKILKKLDPRIKMGIGSIALIIMGVFFYNKFFVKLEKQPILQTAAASASQGANTVNLAAFRDLTQPQPIAAIVTDSTTNAAEANPQPSADIAIVPAQGSVKKEITGENRPANNEVLSEQPIQQPIVKSEEEVKTEKMINASAEVDSNDNAGDADEAILDDKRELKTARREAKAALNNGDVSTAEENYYNIAQTHKKNNNPEEAKKYLNKVIELDGSKKAQAEKEMQEIE